MGYNEFSFHASQLLTTADLVIPDANFHFRFSRDSWATCSILSKQTEITNSPTVNLLQEISNPHDFIAPDGEFYSVPLGYTEGGRLIKSFINFLSNTKQGEVWQGIISFEPLGFVIYGRWNPEGAELCVEDARASIVKTVFSLPKSSVLNWVKIFDQLREVIFKVN